MRSTTLLASLFLSLTSTSFAFPLLHSPLLKRQYCGATSQVCGFVCCLENQFCGVDTSHPENLNYYCSAGVGQNQFQGTHVYTTDYGSGPTLLTIYVPPVAGQTQVITDATVAAVTTFITNATPAAPTTVVITSATVAGFTTAIPATGTFVAPVQPSGSDGAKITFVSVSTGTFLPAIPTGTAVIIPGIAAGATAGGGGGLTAGQIAGIIAGIIGGLGLLALLCLWCCLYGLCAAFRKSKRTESSRSTVVVEHHPAAWVRYVPGGRVIHERLGLGTAAVGGAALATAASRRRRTQVVSEKRKDSGYGRYALMAGSLGTYWLYEKFFKSKEDRSSTYSGVGGGAAGYYQKPVQHVVAGTATSYSSSSSSSSSESSSSSSASESSYFSHSSSSSGVRSVDDRRDTRPPRR